MRQNTSVNPISFHAVVICATVTIALGAITLPTVADLTTNKDLDSSSSINASPLCLWYRQPAEKWIEALPIGNGRVGAMVFGGLDQEKIQFNEETVWTGKPHAYHREGAVKVLPELRRLLAAGKQREAEDLAMQEFMSDPLRQMAYQPCGDIVIEFPATNEVAEYRRQLDLDTAITSVSYRLGDTSFLREAFVSHPAQALCWQSELLRPGQVTAAFSLTSPHQESESLITDEHTLVLRGRVSDGAITFETRLRVAAQGGRVSHQGARSM